MKRFLYLFQVEQELPPSLEQAAGADSDIQFLSWRARSTDPRSIHYPSSSWTQGRNRLLKEAHGRGYLYVVFADDDIVITLTELGSSVCGADASPWRVFEEFLLDREPAIGCCAYDWHLRGGWFDPAQDCQTLRFFDAILNAFHHEALDALLPYCDLLDEQSECYSQNLLCSLAADLYPGHVIQTNRLLVTNIQSRRTDSEMALCKPEHLYLASLRDAEWARSFRRQSIGDLARHPDLGRPLAKTASYAVAENELARHYDLGHALWARRQELKALPFDDEFFSEDADSPRARRWRSVRTKAALPHGPVVAASDPRGPTGLPGFARAVLQNTGVRSHPLFPIARDLYRGRGRPRAIVQALRGIKTRWPARRVWRSWYRHAERVYEIAESRQEELLELLAFALNATPGPDVVFVDVGAARGDVLHQLASTGLRKRLFSLGIDPLDLRAHWSYTGFVLAAVTDGPEGAADFYRYGSSDCSSLKRMDPSVVTHDPSQKGRLYYSPAPIERLEETIRTATFNLSTILQQYGLADEVLHFVKIDAQGSDLDVFRSLGKLSARCLFLRLETVSPADGGSAPGLYEGQTTFAEDRVVLEAAGFRLFNVARFGSTPEADATFVNVRLFEELLPHFCR